MSTHYTTQPLQRQIHQTRYTSEDTKSDTTQDTRGRRRETQRGHKDERGDGQWYAVPCPVRRCPRTTDGRKGGGATGEDNERETPRGAGRGRGSNFRRRTPTRGRRGGNPRDESLPYCRTTCGWEHDKGRPIGSALVLFRLLFARHWERESDDRVILFH